MAEIYRITTLNINGMASGTKNQMLEDLLHGQQIDILFVQEVTNDAIGTIRGYAGYFNIGTTNRGTAIHVKDVTYLLRSLPASMILGGDIKCVLSPTDCTGEPKLQQRAGKRG
jgi:predicted phage tail protein